MLFLNRWTYEQVVSKLMDVWKCCF